MAKFKIDPTLIAALTETGFIDGSGDIEMTFAARGDDGGSIVSKFYKLTFSAASDIIETTNQRMIDSIETMPPPAVKKNGTWIIGNPSTVKLFEAATGDITVDPAVSGIEQITREEKALVVRYVNMSKDGPEPAGRDKTTLQPWVVKARKYFAGRGL